MLPARIVQDPLAGGSVSGWVATSDPCPPEWDEHRAFEISIVLSGSHQRYAADLAFSLGPGDVSLNPGWELHGWRHVAKTELLVIFFTPDLLGDERFGGVSWLDMFAAPPAQRPRATSDRTRRDVLNIAGDLRPEIEKRQPGWRTAIRIGILRLLFALSRDWRPPGPSRSGDGSRLGDLCVLAPAIRLVSARSDRRVALEEAAKACLLSRSWFSAVFHRTLGMSFGQFALRSRLAHAAQLLVTSQLTVGGVAEATGFGDRSHLHHMFVRHYGCTPAHYRGRGR